VRTRRSNHREKAICVLHGDISTCSCSCFQIVAAVSPAQNDFQMATLRRRKHEAAPSEVTSTIESQNEEKDVSTGLPFVQLFAILAAARVAWTLHYRIITDCDQTFNYEEPTHFLMYGRGLQTWEYAPEYALRSYAYTGFHAVVGWLVGGAWAADKIAVFHRIHIVLALASAAAEAYFVAGIARTISRRVAIFTVIGLATSAGMAHAAPAYLPSTFTMVGLLFGWGAWMHRRLSLTVATMVFGLLLGWPFAVVAVVPLGLHILRESSLVLVAFHAIWTVLVVSALCVGVDVLFYEKWLLAPFNIILYNAFGIGGGGQGSDLYGVEPASFYAFNLALNFNLQFVASMVSPFVVMWQLATQRRSSTVWKAVLLSQYWIWFALMSARPHKEERFLFVVYPLISLASAVAVDGMLLACDAMCHGSHAKSRTALSRPAVALATTFFMVSTLCSVSRIAALVDGFSAPVAAWTALGRYIQQNNGNSLAAPPSGMEIPGLTGYPPLTARAFYSSQQEEGIRICVGKEWYRFPSAFFLPEATRADLFRTDGRRAGGAATVGFLQSHFRGQLPQQYLPVNGSSARGRSFNDENKEEPDRYVPLASCDFVVDLQLPTDRSLQDAQYEPYFDSLQRNCSCTDRSAFVWHSIWQQPFLHSDSSPSLYRAFYVPVISRQRNKYGSYHILERQDCDYSSCGS
jgi:alpha-1,2-mannosyltransferase